MPTPEDIVRECFRAYEEGDRDIIEPLLADDYEFWSPPDPGIDRESYFERCWPNAGMIGSFEPQLIAREGDAVLINYIGVRKDGSRFKNTEIHHVRDGQVHRTEVYFGWDLED